MRFEWDEAKNGSNFAKHGLRFEDAETVFSGPCVTFVDDRFWWLSPTRCVARERESSPCGKETGVSRKSIKSDLGRIDRMKDADIDYSDIPALDKTFLKKATATWPPVKKQLTIRLDADVLAWLKGHGRGYQTRINRILRVVMESQPPPRAR
jgi:uncharacterized protein (DUF4415 family)